MRTKKGQYQAALERHATLTKTLDEAGEKAYLLHSLARDCDNLLEQTLGNVGAAKRNLEELARYLSEGYRQTSNPCASSAIYDLPGNLVALDTKREMFFALAQVLLTKEECKAIKQELGLNQGAF